MSPKMVNVGLIGAGRIGQLHAENLVSRVAGAKLVIVSDAVEAAARQCAERYGIATIATDEQAVLEHPGLDAVLICSPTDMHAQQIEAAAAAGKHIFCEKPISHSLTSIDRVLAAVERAGVVFQVGFNRRFDANYRRVRAAIGRGEIGQPQLLHIISRDPAPPPIEYIQRSGGLFLDMTIHDFDMARFLIGAEVEQVYAAAGVMVDPAIGAAGDLDTALIVLEFTNGVIGTIDNSRRAVYGYDQRVEVLGSAGAISIANNYPNTATISDAQGVRRDLPLNFFLDRYVESYVAEVAEFVAAVANGTPPPVSGYDGRVPVQMALAARKSYDEHRPVRLDEI